MSVVVNSILLTGGVITELVQHALMKDGQLPQDFQHHDVIGRSVSK